MDLKKWAPTRQAWSSYYCCQTSNCQQQTSRLTTCLSIIHRIDKLATGWQVDFKGLFPPWKGQLFILSIINMYYVYMFVFPALRILASTDWFSDTKYHERHLRSMNPLCNKALVIVACGHRIHDPRLCYISHIPEAAAGLVELLSSLALYGHTL